VNQIRDCDFKTLVMHTGDMAEEAKMYRKYNAEVKA